MGYRQKIIALVTFLGGLYFFLEFLLPESLLEQIGVAEAHTNISWGFVAFGVMAVGLGIINLFMVHGARIIFVRQNWFYSLVLLAGLVVMMSVSIADWILSERANGEARELRMLASFSETLEQDRKEPQAGVPEFSVRVHALKGASANAIRTVQEKVASLREREDAGSETDQKLFYAARESFEAGLEKLKSSIAVVGEQRDEIEDGSLPSLSEAYSELSVSYGRYRLLHVERGIPRKLFTYLYEGFIVSLGAAMFSLLGVYIAAAAFRAFRIRNIESFLMMSAAIVVMLGQIPFHSYLAFDLGLFTLDFPYLRQWLMQWPNGAAFRAIAIGAAIAGLIMAFRMWLSIESKGFEESESPKN